MGKKIENRCGLPKNLADEGIISVNFGVSYFPIDAIEEMGFNFTELEDNGFSLDRKTYRNTEICNSAGGYEICFEELCGESTCHHDQEVFNPENWMDYVMVAGQPLEEYLWQEMFDSQEKISITEKPDKSDTALDKWWHHPAVHDDQPIKEPKMPRKPGGHYSKKDGEYGGTARYRDFRGPSSRKPRYKKPWRPEYHDHRIRGNRTVSA